MHRLAFAALSFLALLASVSSVSAAEPRAARVRRAERLAAHAQAALAQRSIEGRQAAIRDLEEATLLVPERGEWQLTLARTYMMSGFLGLARHRFEKVQAFSPEDAASCFGLGQVWRYDWLKYLDQRSRERAIDNFTAAARLDPGSPDAWIMLVPMLVERGDLRTARSAAQRAVAADPGRADARLADAYTAYRSGMVEHADSVFRVVVPQLPRALRARFEDISPVALEADTLRLRRLWPHDRPEFVRRFWREQDPDLASPENEAQLEYWARVAHAYLMYYDARRQVWDERGEIYVRYGAPARQEYNGIGEALTQDGLAGLNMPVNVLVWEYPELGMRVKMQDRLLNGFYLPNLRYSLIDSRIDEPTPDLDSLVQRGLFGVRGGRGVFPSLPPGSRPVPVVAALARFEGATQPRVLGGLEVESSPGDSMTAIWVVRDSAGIEVARASRRLSPSACDPAGVQVADFTAELPSGRYSVGLSVRGADRRRGTVREEIWLAPVHGEISLSDVVVSCGVPDASLLGGAEPSVRVEPNPAARVAAGDPLTAYFEIYHLTPSEEGLSRFEFEYEVRSATRDARVWLQRLFSPRPAPPTIRTEREEQQIGSLRRQFVSVPVQALAPGRYRLQIRVKDLVSGHEATASADFVRVPVAATR